MNLISQNARICIKCKMILTFDAFTKIQEEQAEKDGRLINMEKQIDFMNSQLYSVVTAINNLSQHSKNRFSKELFRAGIFKSEVKRDHLPT